MSKESNETPIPSKKVFSFFNYKNIVSDLSVQLLKVGFEYRSLSGNNDLPESYQKLISFSTNDHIARIPQQMIKGNKKFVLIDQYRVIHQLKERISILTEAIHSLKTNNVAAHDSDSLEDPNLLNTPTSSPDKKFDSLSEIIATISDANVPVHPNNDLPPETASPAKLENLSESKITITSHCSGIFPFDKRLVSFLCNRFDPRLYEYPEKIGSTVAILQITPTLTFKILFLEEEEFSMMGPMRKNGTELLILFFCLNSPNSASDCYRIANERFRNHGGFVKMNCIIGIHDRNKLNTDALFIFDKFRHEHSIENTLVCEYTVEGQEKYVKFMQSIAHKLLDTPHDIPLAPKEAPQPPTKKATALISFNLAKIALEKGNLFDALKWADLALNDDPRVLNPPNTLDFPETVDFLQIVANKLADQEFFSFIEASDFNFARIDTNPTKEYFLALEDKSLFLDDIKKYKSMASCIDRPNEPLVHLAASLGYHHFIKWLLSNGVPVDCLDQDGKTPLLVAAFYGYEPLINLLLQRDAHILHETTNNLTALLLASQSGHLSTVKLLVEKPANSVLRKIHLNMANLHAAMRDHIDIMQYFLKVGADMNFRTTKGISVLCGAVMYNSLICAKFLLDHGVKPNTSNRNFQNELSSCKSIEMVDLLVAYGADVHFQGNQNISLLTHAVETGQLALVKHLIELGALLPTISTTLTPLMCASQVGHLNIAIFLVEECHVDIDQVIKNSGRTALITSAYYNRFEVTQYLLDHHPKINCINDHGWTALTAAADQGHRNIVSLLLSRGANPKNIGKAALSSEGLKMIQEEYAKLNLLSPMIHSTMESELPSQGDSIEEQNVKKAEADNNPTQKSDEPNRCNLM